MQNENNDDEWIWGTFSRCGWRGLGWNVNFTKLRLKLTMLYGGTEAIECGGNECVYDVETE